MELDRFRGEAERAGYLTGKHSLRAGQEDRHKAHTILRKAFSNGRLNENQYHTRTSHLDMASSQDDLRTIVRDLPEGNSAPGIYEDWHRFYVKHPWTLHFPVMIFILSFVAACYVPEWVFLGSQELWGGQNGWALIPIFSSIAGLIALAVNFVKWRDGKQP